MKKVHYMTFTTDFDYPMIDFDSVEDYIYKKINAINSYIKDNIDKQVAGFLFEEFFDPSDSVKNIPINSPDLLKYIKNKLKTDENGVDLRVVFIFDPKEDELEIWKSEFLELSERLEMVVTISGHHSEYDDIVRQIYDNGDYDTGIIATDLEVFNSPMSMYKMSKNPRAFPKASIFKISNYSAKN
jgi:hypothetical protein